MGKKTKKKQLSRKALLRELVRRARLRPCTEYRDGQQCWTGTLGRLLEVPGGDVPVDSRLLQELVGRVLRSEAVDLRSWPRGYYLVGMFSETGDGLATDHIVLLARDGLSAVLDRIGQPEHAALVLAETDGLAPAQRMIIVMANTERGLLFSAVAVSVSMLGSMFGAQTVGEA